MRYNPKARLDRSQMQVRSGGPSRGPLGGGGLRVGGGIGGVLVLVVVVLLQSGVLGGADGTSAGPGSADRSSNLAGCRTGADANQRSECALLADVNSIQAYWEQALPRQTGLQYRPAVTTVFSGGTRTGCGTASSDVGPFYCPTDEGVYLDPGFFDAMLEGELGARGGLFSEAYVLAHEYGHHVQNLTGQMGRVRTQQGPTSDAVRLELQADCYAGMWAKHASQVPDATGEPFLVDLTARDIADAVDAAQAVGDDRIQQRSGAGVEPDRWTHGSAAQRTAWFRVGLARGSMEACDTFAADRL